MVPGRRFFIIMSLVLVFGFITGVAPLTGEEKKKEYQIKSGLSAASGLESSASDYFDPGIAIVGKETYPHFPSRAQSTRKLTSDMFSDPEFCGGCHEEIYEQWNGSMHSHAWNDPVFQAALKKASKATGTLVDKLCIGCHSPIGLLTGEASVTGENMSEVAKKGVSCDFCHSISEVRGVGNAPFVLDPQNNPRALKRGPFRDSVSPFHDTEYSEVFTKSEICGACHNVSHPLNRMPIERTYDEWKDSPYAGKGVQCQDCHMTPGPGVKDNPGTATSFSKKRRQIYTHYFIGGNVIVPELMGSKKHAQLAREMLQAAATIEMETPKKLKQGSTARIDVKVTNSGAGHKLPTGFPEGREVWVDFKVTDAAGKLIYRLGAVKDGLTEKGTKSFKVVLGDPEGNIVDLELWEADKILYDTRILPHGYAELDYSFFVPKNAKSPLTITADLNYWSFPQFIADKLLGEGAPKIPIIKMTSVSRKVETK